MKKKILLIALPALMVISGCSTPVKSQKESMDSFFEDTLAHEEVFGNSEAPLKTDPYRTISDVESYITSDIPTIGVQTNDELDDGYAMRFVSAVRIEDEDLATANLSWTRAIFNSDHTVKKSEDHLPVEKLYTALANGDTPITIDDFNSAHHTNYNYFAVYTVRKIDRVNQAKFVINANLVCNGTSSKVLSTTIDQTTQFTFNTNDTGYFGVRKNVSGSFESFSADDDPGSNNASFTNIPIEKDESFIIVNRASDWFEIHGYDKTHLADSGDNNFGEDDMAPFAKAKLSLLSYSLYLSKGGNTFNWIYSNRAVQLFLVPNDNWHKDNARFALNLVVDSDEKWFSMSKVGEENLYVCTVPFSNINFGRLIFCRMKPEDTTNNWTNKWNQTGDLSWNDTNNKFTLNEGSWDSGSWSIQAIH